MSNKNPKKGMKVMNDFRKFATQKLGMNGLVLDEVVKAQQQYMNPYILEERQLNVTQMDVYSRLMMDRIIFLGSEIDDYAANTLQAQLLYLDSVDSGKDISIYINSPGGSVTAGLGIYDTMQFISSDVATICTGMAASMAASLESSVLPVESITSVMACSLVCWSASIWSMAAVSC